MYHRNSPIERIAQEMYSRAMVAQAASAELMQAFGPETGDPIDVDAVGRSIDCLHAQVNELQHLEFTLRQFLGRVVNNQTPK
jgi:hypothetical protein